MKLTLSPRCWAKIQFMYNLSVDKDVEAGGFLICPFSDYPLFADDYSLVGADCSEVSVEHDGTDLVKHIKKYRDSFNVSQFARIHTHHHPGFTADPSKTDEALCKQLSQDSDWFIIFIIGAGDYYCRAHYQTPFGMRKHKIPFEIDWNEYLGSIDINDSEEKWEEEFKEAVRIKRIAKPKKVGYNSAKAAISSNDDLWDYEKHKLWEGDEYQGLPDEWKKEVAKFR